MNSMQAIDELADVLENVLIVLQEKEDIELNSEYDQLIALRDKLPKRLKFDYDPMEWEPEMQEIYFVISPPDVKVHTNYYPRELPRHRKAFPGGLFKTREDAEQYLEGL